MKKAVVATKTARTTADQSRICRRCQRVREIEDREGLRGRQRVGEDLRGEEHVGGESGVEDAVAGLRDEPGGEQPPEVPLGEHDAQVGNEMPLHRPCRQRAMAACQEGHVLSLWRIQCARRTGVPRLAGHRAVRGARRSPQRSTSSRMNLSTRSRAVSSLYCSGGDFMKYEAAESTGPPMPRSLAIFAARTASMMTPAEFGESH